MVCFITVAFEKNQEKDAFDDDLAARQLFSRGGKELSRRDARDDDTQQKSTRGAERRDVDVPLFFIKPFAFLYTKGHTFGERL